MLETTLDILFSGVEYSMLAGKHKDIADIVSRVSSSRGVDHIRIFDQNGVILQSADPDEIGQDLLKVAPYHANENDLFEPQIHRLKDRSVFSATIPIVNKPACQSCHQQEENIAYLDIDSDFTLAERYFYTGSFHILFLAVVIIAVLFLGFYFLFNRLINRPLLRFNEAMNEVEKGNLDRHLPAPKNDEIGQLEGHFNRMITKLKSSQNEIEELHLEQLQRADKMVTLGELAAEMAHEVNNPAAIIQSRVDYLDFEANKSNELKKYREDLEVIANQISKVSGITGNILKYSKKLPKKFNRIDLVTLINDSLHILGPRLAKRNISVKKDFAKIDTHIVGDAQQLEQTIINLINNSVDAIIDTGVITISLAMSGNDQLQLRITDTGTGIDHEAMTQIFSPFFTTKAADKGTGLGLYIVKNICNNHHAQISCESTYDQGTTFTITFNEKGHSV